MIIWSGKVGYKNKGGFRFPIEINTKIPRHGVQLLEIHGMVIRFWWHIPHEIWVQSI